jgi:hypothetical protein
MTVPGHEYRLGHACLVAALNIVGAAQNSAVAAPRGLDKPLESKPT